MDVAWIAVAAAAVAYYVLGAVWFTPVFGATYDRALGVDRTTDAGYTYDYYVVPLVSAVCVSTAVGILASLAGADGLVEHARLGLLTGGLIALPVSLNNALNPATPHPYAYGLVTGGYHLTGSLLVGVVMGLLT